MLLQNYSIALYYSLPVDRTELTKVFLNTLEQTYNSDRGKIHFDHSLLVRITRALQPSIADSKTDLS